LSKGVFNILLNLPKKGIVKKNVLEKNLFGEKQYPAPNGNSSRLSIKVLIFFIHSYAWLAGVR